MITNTTERQKAQFIYETYFNTDSEHLLDFNLFDTLALYEVIEQKKADKLDKLFEAIGNNLFNAMVEYDKQLLKKR